ncbi:MAG: 4'-phosphopantetheinyl transferase superfamily protein [Proteobacteria bacterium]|nr:4'-phosphopantetheinyl transferase superfamily protein [Pseudomonadota bacterium]
MPHLLPKLELSKSRIDLWCVFQDEITDQDLLNDYEKLLSPDERDQWPKFHFEKHRHQYLVSRALVRTTISRYLIGHPGDWRYVKNKYGRPEIIQQQNHKNLRFNLSHTEGMIILGICLDDDLGVDVEDIKRDRSLIGIADRYFSPLEVEELRSLPEDQQQTRFFDYWTLKESFIKARGMGLSLPLDQFSFHLGTNKPFQISFDSNDDHTLWQFWQIRLSEKHIGAIAIQRSQQSNYQLTIKKTIPLLKDLDFDYHMLR